MNAGHHNVNLSKNVVITAKQKVSEMSLIWDVARR